MAEAAAERSGDAAVPFRTTCTPPIHTSIAPGFTPAPDRPTAARMRPQLGSPPHSAVFTSGDVITAVAARFASSPDRAPRTRRPPTFDAPSASRITLLGSAVG